MKIELICETCGKAFERNPSQVSKNNFCSRQCAKAFTSKRMTEYNKTTNPKNTSEGWSEEQREAVRKREQNNRGPCRKDVYPKHGRKHKHRRVAEEKLGRPLKKGEVVHHIDGDKHNNEPENLMVFKNQKEHAKYHAEHPEESGVYLGKRVIK